MVEAVVSSNGHSQLRRLDEEATEVIEDGAGEAIVVMRVGWTLVDW